uniref:Ribosomal protein L23 n=1 Tax=Lathyrus odoratus TaxID=3859 RepID=A0A0F6NKR4_LATOD|nr:ribosomal protein L23 [Lathyrus odoratus]AIL55910.1 ribosomal protein L23 [Lathyrus odoratus]
MIIMLEPGYSIP